MDLVGRVGAIHAPRQRPDADQVAPESDTVLVVWRERDDVALTCQEVREQRFGESLAVVEGEVAEVVELIGPVHGQRRSIPAAVGGSLLPGPVAVAPGPEDQAMAAALRERARCERWGRPTPTDESCAIGRPL
jgi:hypothetical protein